MSDEQIIYTSPLGNWKIITCCGLWGVPKYEVEKFYGGFWHSIFDGQDSLKKCFNYLRKQNIISPDENTFLFEKWKL